ncbi:MAG: ATP-binding protein [Spirochaetes bacterium]|nr:ATP-binding protein [Spirochaetota bacterium]
MSNRTLFLAGYFLVAAVLTAQEPLLFRDFDKIYKVTEHIEYFIDDSGELTIDEISKPEGAARFKPVESKGVNLGYGEDKSAYWIRFSVFNDSETESNLVLIANYVWFCKISLFLKEHSGSWLEKWTGYCKPVDEKEYQTIFHAFDLKLKPQTTTTCYLQIKSKDLIILDFSLMSMKRFFKLDHEKQLWFGFYYGCIIIMIIYNLVLFIFIREKAYLFFSLSLMSMALGHLYGSGHFYEYFRSFINWLTFDPYYFALTLYGVFIPLFFMEFLNTREYLPKLTKVIYLVSLTSFLLGCIGYFIPERLWESIILVYNIITSVAGLAIAFYCMIKKSPYAKHFIISFLILMITGELEDLSAYNILPYQINLADLGQFGFLIMIVLLSLALGDRYRIMRREKYTLQTSKERQEQFFLNLAHEVRTPLTLISNYLDAFMQKGPAAKELVIIQRNMHKLTRDIWQFFDILGFEKKILPAERKEVLNLTALIQDKLEMLKQSALPENIQILSEVESEIIINAQSYMLERIINNLLENALKYNKPHGMIKVKLTRSDADIVLSVFNTGEIISKKNQKHIFEPYYQLAHKKSNRQGIGLGLAIVKKMVQQMGGQIGLECDQQRGNTFQVLLPANSDDPAAAEILQAGQITPFFAQPATTLTSASHSKVRGEAQYLLLVEDNLDLLELLQKNLSADFTVLTATTGTEAISILTQNPLPSLIISDVMMDDMDGYEFFHQLQIDKSYQHIPFIFITARHSLEEKYRTLQEGAVDYIFKPFLMEELIAKIRSILRLKEIKSHAEELERLKSLGMLVGSLSHEINNPLSGITGPLSNIKKIIAESEIDQKRDLNIFVDYIDESVKRLVDLVNNIKNLYLKRELKQEPLNLDNVLSPLLDKLKKHSNKPFRTETQFHQDLTILADRGAFEIILSNLLENAREAVKEDGVIRVSFAGEPAKSKLTIFNDGDPIPEAEKNKLFDAFYTSKSISGGHGLGLFIVKDLVTRLGWAIDTTNEAQGVTFGITMPNSSTN